MSNVHLQEELSQNPTRIEVDTRYGPIKGGRAANGAAVFLEIPYALPPGRFEDPQALPPDFRYEEKEYTKETSYAVQPMNDGQARGVSLEDKLGLGDPTENPLFVNIVCPPSFPSKGSFPVRVYIHGGYLQYGSPHGLGSQAQYVSAARSEVWVNIGYRLSAFGFLACDEPRLDGNYGFKDQWLALQWIKNNIAAFGGDPEDIQITGLSAGGHSVHQILHHASRLPPGEKAPFHSAILQSNAIIATPKTPAELRPQFQALCRALKLDPTAKDVLSKLRDPSQVPWSSITHAIETDSVGIAYGTYRGSLDDRWLAATPDPMTWQRSGDFARGLRDSGVRSVVIGDLTEEWYIYSLTHSSQTTEEMRLNLRRCFSDQMVDDMIDQYPTLPDGAAGDDVQKLYGEILSDGQVHCPVRMFIRDLKNAGFPAFRYQIAWTPEQVRPEGYVTHATDRPLWAFRLPTLEPSQVKIAETWLDTIAAEMKLLEKTGTSDRGMREVLKLKENQTIEWGEDQEWNEKMRLARILPGE